MKKKAGLLAPVHRRLLNQSDAASGMRRPPALPFATSGLRSLFTVSASLCRHRPSRSRVTRVSSGRGQSPRSAASAAAGPCASQPESSSSREQSGVRHHSRCACKFRGAKLQASLETGVRANLVENPDDVPCMLRNCTLPRWEARVLREKCFRELGYSPLIPSSRIKL